MMRGIIQSKNLAMTKLIFYLGVLLLLYLFWYIASFEAAALAGIAYLITELASKKEVVIDIKANEDD